MVLTKVAEEVNMNNGDLAVKSQTSILIMPKTSYCYDFMESNFKAKKTVFLVPHVIKHRDHSEIISWRCNWGNICNSKCIYATTKNTIVTHQNLDEHRNY
jgi:hypothetical protein